MTGFFVLSGYIMAHVHKNHDFSHKKEVFNYYLKRIARIYPAYIFASLFYFIAVNSTYTTDEWWLIIINDILLTQAFFEKVCLLGINDATWSVSCEAFFYLLFPFIILEFKKSNPKWILTLTIIIAIVYSCSAFFHTPLNGAEIHLYFNPLVRINEFVMGIAFCTLGYNNKVITSFSCIPLLSIALFILTILDASKNQFHYMGAQFLIAPILGVLICALAHWDSKFTTNAVMLFLGRISYSFYLWQFTSFTLTERLVTANYITIPQMAIFFALAINLATASLSYYFIEIPLREKILRLQCKPH